MAHLKGRFSLNTSMSVPPLGYGFTSRTLLPAVQEVLENLFPGRNSR